MGMPAEIERQIKARGGVVRWRTITLSDGSKARVAVTRDPGPNGGRVVLVKRLH